MADIHKMSIVEMSHALRNQHLSSVEITTYYLDRIQRYDPFINSFITVDEEGALNAAKESDQRLASGKALSALEGIPLAHKDLFCTQGLLTTSASKMLSNFVAPYDATLVKQLKDTGTVLLGKLSMDEFAMGSDNETSYYGVCRNPWDGTRVPGGSSGGSAAAVAAGLVPFATGSDTGGSIRQPASFCGVTGIKPTYGRISRYGMIAYASSLDQPGAFGRSALDCAYLMQPMAGFDTKDATSVNRPVPNWIKSLEDLAVEDQPLKGMTIGYASEYFGDGLDDEVAQIVKNTFTLFEQLGATIKEIHLTKPSITLATYYLLASAEASSNLSRFDGVRFGHRAANPESLEDLYKRSRSEGFGDEVQRRILMGTYVLSAGYYDAYYVKAQKTRRLVVEDFNQAFETCDLIISPTAPTPAYRIEEELDPVTRYLGDVYTIAANLAGLPAISLPAGFSKNNLPVGLHMMAKHWKETDLLKAAHVYQTHTNHHKQTPNMQQETF